MWLINTATLKLHNFLGSDVPPYGILSHRWEADEVSHKDVLKLRNLESPGWDKVRSCCDLARNTFGREWVWIDTACIDQRSSQDVSEAINSMFRWYADAQECYAYLSDVGGSDIHELMRSFYESKWFTRGWTLQELLAPQQVYFVEQNWRTILGARNVFPTKYSAAPFALLQHISNITEIDAETLDAPYTGKSYYELPDGRFKPTASRAQRMFWASKRQCTREEDHAYCLLGLFGVNMSLIYGEGREKALARLREEILKKPDEAEQLLLVRPSNGAGTFEPRQHKL